MESLQSWDQEKRKEARWGWEDGPEAGGWGAGEGGDSWGPGHFILCVLDRWAARGLSHPKIQSFRILQDFFSLLPF